MQRKTAEAPQAGRADVLASQLLDISRAQAARAIQEGRLWADGQLVGKAGTPLRAGALLALEVPPPAEMELEKQDIPISILYQDEDIALVVKPAGMVVHPAAGNESGTLVNALLFAMEGLSGIGGIKRPGIVHRLDKDTSGLLLVAKNDAAHQGLSAQLRARTMEKHYLAVVEGEMKHSQGQVDAPLARSKRDRKRMAVDAGGREALTQWTLLENLRGGALLDVRIITGRTHQIRVHMQSLHHPVAGDPVYGHTKGLKASRLMLHAYSLAFTHPRTGQRLHFVAPPPDAFTAAVQKWRREPGLALPYRQGRGEA